MDKKTSNRFTVTIWDKMNIFLASATATTTITFIVLFIASFINKPETPYHGMILGMCGVFASLASAFFIAWIMRLYELKKKRKQELKALDIIRPYLVTAFTTINDFFPQLKNFATINFDDTIQYPLETIYYRDASNDNGNRSFIDLNLAFKEAYSKLDSDLRDCLSSPILFQCNEEIVNLLTGLKLNGLTKNLFEIYKSSLKPFFSNISFMGLHNNFIEFSSYYELLAEATMRTPINKLEELSPDEKNMYILEIDAIKKQIPVNHEGKIFKGTVRIQ